MSGTLIMNLLATLFMTQLMYVIGVGGTEVSILLGIATRNNVNKTQTFMVTEKAVDKRAPESSSKNKGNGTSLCYDFKDVSRQKIFRGCDHFLGVGIIVR